MKFKPTLTFFSCLVMLLGSISLQAQTPHLQNIRAITSSGEEYSTPVWSPDGQKLLFTDHHNSALFIIEVTENSRVQKLREGAGIGYKAKWAPGGEGVVFYEKETTLSGSRTFVEKQFDIKEDKIKVLSQGVSENPNRMFSAGKKPELKVYINPETLKLEAREGNGRPWVITKEEGQFYSPLISPDGNHVVVNEGPNMYLYAIKGTEKRKSLGIGLPSSWLPDGSGILTFEDETNDGHSISGSELYHIAVRNSVKTQLTNTPDKIEMWADISPDGKKIAFSDEKTGKIYVADLNINR